MAPPFQKSSVCQWFSRRVKKIEKDRKFGDTTEIADSLGLVKTRDLHVVVFVRFFTKGRYVLTSAESRGEIFLLAL